MTGMCVGSMRAGTIPCYGMQLGSVCDARHCARQAAGVLPPALSH